MPPFTNDKKNTRVVPGILPEQKQSSDDSSLKKITENLYKQNLEIALKNKTLSLLRQLYQISILTLEPADLGRKIVATIRGALEFELVGIFTLDQAADQLNPLKFDVSPRLHELNEKHNLIFDAIAIPHVSQWPFFKKIIQDKVPNNKYDILKIWENTLPAAVINDFKRDSHIKTTVGYPLIIENRVIGVFLVSINREYDSLPNYEKESLLNYVDVIAVALDRARLYKEVTVANQQLEQANNRLKELDQLKSEFVSLATHQIRAPLTAIKGYVSLVQEGDYGPVTPEVLKALDIIMQSTNNLVTIVGDFLDVSRIEQNRMKYDYTDFDLEKLVSQVATEYQPNVAKKGLALKYTFEQGKAYMVHADLGKIKQVIGNIIDNSIKYTPKGEIDVSLTGKGDKFLIKISDTGVGIPPTTIPKLFQKFTRAENANETNILGTGLGLYVARQMIEAHHGRVWAESAGEGKGSQFYIELPVAHVS